MDYQVLKLDYFSDSEIQQIIGVGDENLKCLKDLYHSDILYRNDEIKLFSNDERLLKHLERQMKLIRQLMDHHQEITPNVIYQTFRTVKDETEDDFIKWNQSTLAYTISGRPIKAKTLNQYKLIEAIERHDMVFSIGPAGTGKTFLAVLMAVKAYKNGDVKKIVLTRPAVEAGESLGFLPGDLKEKIDPYLMPLYDALDELLGPEQSQKLIERNIIEVIPLAYMRGRTLNEAFVILDEAQNTTNSQMLMFLTRLGYKSKMLINGDITQIDLKIKKEESGLIVASKKLKDVKEIAFVKLDKGDVVRNPLVQKIIESYQ